jgi:type I restriction enzyme, S subunit
VKYKAYRDSSIAWLGEIPEHWSMKRLKFVGTATIGLTYEPSNLVDQGDGTLVLRSSNIQNGKIVLDDNVYVQMPIPDKLIARKGDILICSRNGSRDLIGKNAQIDEASVGSSFGAFTTLFRSEYNRYLFYLFNSRLFEYQSGRFLTSTINQLTITTLNGFEVPFPPPDEQDSIADYLDQRTAKIDTLIRKKEELIEKLQEKRSALISRTVIRGLPPNAAKAAGLNPHPKMKDSGIEWLGEMPEHWDIKRLGSECEFISYGFTNPMPTTDDGPRMLTANDINYGRVQYETARCTSPEAYAQLTQKSKPRRRDILVTKDGTLGRVGVVHSDDVFCINQSVALLRPKATASEVFISLALESSPYKDRMLFEAGGTTIKHIYITRLARMPLAVPPKLERAAICKYVENETVRIDELINRIETAVEWLYEYRSALITAAVTGKIDVRNYSGD